MYCGGTEPDPGPPRHLVDPASLLEPVSEYGGTRMSVGRVEGWRPEFDNRSIAQFLPLPRPYLAAGCPTVFQLVWFKEAHLPQDLQCCFEESWPQDRKKGAAKQRLKKAPSQAHAKTSARYQPGRLHANLRFDAVRAAGTNVNVPAGATFDGSAFQSVCSCRLNPL